MIIRANISPFTWKACLKQIKKLVDTFLSPRKKLPPGEFKGSVFCSFLKLLSIMLKSNLDEAT